MFASTLPPAPIEVIRPGWSPGFVGSIENSVSTIRDRGWTRFHPSGAPRESLPLATVNSERVSAKAPCIELIESIIKNKRTRTECIRERH